MPSRLSSLLVRDGLVGVKRMEKAFQRQVIYGGSLDTTLLEMGLVPEDRLTQYLALTSGLPPANRAECNVFDAAAVQRCPVEAATQYHVVPLTFEHGSLRVLVHDPVDMAALEEILKVPTGSFTDALRHPAATTVSSELDMATASARIGALMEGVGCPDGIAALEPLSTIQKTRWASL